MAKFEPGKSGNPKGRPPKERALTQILERAGSKKTLYGGKDVSRKQVVAELLWQAATTGKLRVEQIDGWIDRLIDTDEWLSIVQFLYKHIDGPPPAKLEHSGANGGPIVVKGYAKFTPDDWDNDTEN